MPLETSTNSESRNDYSNCEDYDKERLMEALAEEISKMQSTQNGFEDIQDIFWSSSHLPVEVQDVKSHFSRLLADIEKVKKSGTSSGCEELQNLKIAFLSCVNLMSSLICKENLKNKEDKLLKKLEKEVPVTAELRKTMKNAQQVITSRENQIDSSDMMRIQQENEFMEKEIIRMEQSPELKLVERVEQISKKVEDTCKRIEELKGLSKEYKDQLKELSCNGALPPDLEEVQKIIQTRKEYLAELNKNIQMAYSSSCQLNP